MSGGADALEALVLSTLDRDGSVESTLALAETAGCDHLALIGVIKSLETDAFVASDELSTSYWQLTEEAEEVVRLGSPEARVFAADAGRIGTVEEARMRCLLDRCVKKTISPMGQHLSDIGQPIDVETFPIGRKHYLELKHYGCSVAVVLYLRFLWEGSIVFLVMYASPRAERDMMAGGRPCSAHPPQHGRAHGFWRQRCR